MRGELALPEAQEWDFAAASNSVTLVANAWQLGQMVALQKNADIEAEDALEGLLPLTIADGRVIINSGYLRALPPGGRNPALHDGQSIRFDINVEQNLDPLLQSLRIGDNLQQRIEGGMQ